MKQVRIMDEGAIRRALTRISYEIIEQQKDVSNLVMLGIKTRGRKTSDKFIVRRRNEK